MTPALFIKTSILFNDFFNVSEQALTLLRLARSNCTDEILLLPDSSLMSRIAASARSLDLQRITTSAPIFANNMADSLPKPVLPEY